MIVKIILMEISFNLFFALFFIRVKDDIVNFYIHFLVICTLLVEKWQILGKLELNEEARRRYKAVLEEDASAIEHKTG